eukprot:CAMPEP_0115480596 /NCGR_PEP_ID=MMETSP0271-20121206/57355_1 /TAXON_ID=71861 /ORGANISM="Scrippsiella trochoidea, Strain CCMP3099" /LENGTH=622 /DNA_ID=CAMNT_0002908287 /DNA_START=19 /DNA_END=1883 /DNA_ORIENTATION=+
MSCDVGREQHSSGLQKMELEEDGPILEHDLGGALERVGKITKERASAFFAQLDSNRDGRIHYSDLEGWFLSDSTLQGSKFLQKCKCPDGHSVSVFRPETDGWCCDDCGDDLETSRPVLQCSDCSGACWCIRCMVQTVDVPVIEKAFLSSIPAARKTTTAATSTASTRRAATQSLPPLQVFGDVDIAQTAGGGSSASRSTASPGADQDSHGEMPIKKYGRRRSSLDFMNEGKGTAAELQYIEELVGQLSNTRVQPRLDALGGLSGLVKDRRLATVVGDHMRALALQFERKGDKQVHLEVFNLLRRLAELGQAEEVGVYAYAFVNSLSDDDVVLTRKAAMLFCILAREGSAPMLTRYIPKLVECFERVEYTITAPLVALQEIADAGEGVAVAPVVTHLLSILLSLNSRCKGAACSVLAAIFRGGGGSAAYRTVVEESLDEQSKSNPDFDNAPLGMLLQIVRDDEDDDVRLLAAQALQSIVLFNEETVKLLRTRHSLLMFNCLGTLHGRNNREARSIISEALGLELSIPEGKNTASKYEDEGGPELCSICFTVGLRCRRGGAADAALRAQVPCSVHQRLVHLGDKVWPWAVLSTLSRHCPGRGRRHERVLRCIPDLYEEHCPAQL